MDSIDDWTDRLAAIVADTLVALAPDIGDDAVSVIALDCHPWNGGLYLAILKRSEIDADPELSDPEEMAAWQFYDCGDRVEAWSGVSDLAVVMQEEYSTATDTAGVANKFLTACAMALSRPTVRRALEGYSVDVAFRFSVTDPDNGQEFCF